MSTTTDAERINNLCSRTMRPSVLNALHACREGHPFGRDNPWKWRNACAMVAQHTIDFLGADTHWLEKRAAAEAAA